MPRQPSQPRTQERVADPDNPASLVDTVIDDRYRLTSLVGRGGMGSVFLAEHVTIRRPVALKLLSPSLAAIPELARRFEREAAAIGRIDHPNCVTVSDFGRLEGGSLYLVMEYLDGRSLSDAIEAEGRIAARRALHIARHVLRGLGHAHQAGIVHRDVKPDNVILVQQDGVPDFAKVLDFGIAHFMDGAAAGREEDDDRLTQAGIAFGTPQDMSPEQAVGDPVDPRADLYSTTVMLFEMIAGRTPFVADEKLELLGMHATRPPPRLSETRPDLLITPELDRLVEVGLAKRPADRFATAEQFIASIEEVLHGRIDGDAPIATPLDDTEPVPVAMDPRLRPPTRAVPLHHTPTPLTHRHRRPPTLRQRILLACGLAALSALGYASYFLFLRPPQVDLLAGLKSEAAAEAEKKLEAGDPDRTIEILTARPGALAGDAVAQMQLGHAHAAKSDYRPALDAYQAAVALDPSVIGDRRVRDNLALMIDDDGGVLVDAARLLAREGKDEAARRRLVELAVHKDRGVRKKAFAVAEELGLGGEIDRLTSFRLDLEQEPTCKARREAVTRLRALGDPKAVAPLRAALDRPGFIKKGRRKRRINENACLRQHAEDAIRALERGVQNE
ncbi:MAG TPA: protein kinase [Kofleriaceae bacterium]|nr:protein kinase [Kofleriaceae bacterium]